MSANVLIRSDNGHTDIRPFPSFEQARYFVKNNISYTGWHIQRVEIVDYEGSTFAVWDRSWDDNSKAVGLKNI
jgi:hypothetical protein